MNNTNDFLQIIKNTFKISKKGQSLSTELKIACSLISLINIPVCSLFSFALYFGIALLQELTFFQRIEFWLNLIECILIIITSVFCLITVLFESIYSAKLCFKLSILQSVFSVLTIGPKVYFFIHFLLISDTYYIVICSILLTTTAINFTMIWTYSRIIETLAYSLKIVGEDFSSLINSNSKNNEMIKITTGIVVSHIEINGSNQCDYLTN